MWPLAMPGHRGHTHSSGVTCSFLLCSPPECLSRCVRLMSVKVKECRDGVSGRDFARFWAVGSSFCVHSELGRYPVLIWTPTSGVCQGVCESTFSAFLLSYYLPFPFPPVTSICPLGVPTCSILSRTLSELLPSSCELPHFQS